MVGVPLTSLIQYRDKLFTVGVTKDITYNTNTIPTSFTLDYYAPSAYAFTGPTWNVGDAPPVGTRPLFIYAHGGGFTQGTKNNEEASYVCSDMASRGYVCFSINYTKMIPYSWGPSEEAAACDMRAAIRFGKQNSGTYNVNTTKIVAAGESAGGCMALWAGISDYEFDNGNNYATYSGANSRPAAIVSFWGKVNNTNHDLSMPPFSTNIASGLADNLIVPHGTADQAVLYRDATDIKTLVDGIRGSSKVTVYTLRDAGHSCWNREPKWLPPRYYADGYYYDYHQTVVNLLKTKLGL